MSKKVLLLGPRKPLSEYIECTKTMGISDHALDAAEALVRAQDEGEGG